MLCRASTFGPRGLCHGWCQASTLGVNILAVSDHIGVAGKDNGRLHRVEIAHMFEQIEQAGFRIEARSDLLANPEDDHSLNVFDDAIYRRTDRILIRAVR